MAEPNRTTVYGRTLREYCCVLLIEEAEAGYIASMSLRLAPEAGPRLRFVLHRALAYVFFRIRCGEHQMDTAADMLDALPDGELAEVERCMLSEIAAWQAERAAEVYPAGGAG